MSLEGLATHAQAFVIGTVVEIRGVDGPWLSFEGSHPLETCDVPVLQGIDLVLDDVVASGGISEVTIRLTADDLIGWSARPVVVGDGVIEWEGDELRGIGYGMRVGGFFEQPSMAAVCLPVGPMMQELPTGQLIWQEDPALLECNADMVDILSSRTADELALEFEEELRTSFGSEVADHRYERSAYCEGDGGIPIPCTADEDPEVLMCPDGRVCDTESMLCLRP